MSDQRLSLEQAEVEAQIIQFHSPETMHRTAYQDMSNQIDDARDIFEDMDVRDIIEFHIDTLEEANQPWTPYLERGPVMLDIDREQAALYLDQLIMGHIMGEDDDVEHTFYAMGVYDEETQGILRDNLTNRVIPNQAKEKNLKPKLEEHGQPYFDVLGDEFKQEVLSRQAMERARTNKALDDLLIAPEQPWQQKITEMQKLADALNKMSFAIAVMPFVDADKAFDLIETGLSRNDQYSDFYDPYIYSIEAMFECKPNRAVELGQMALEHDMVEVNDNTVEALTHVMTKENLASHTSFTVAKMVSDFIRGV